MTRKKIPGWIVMAESDPGGGARCQRCGVVEPGPRLPITIDGFQYWAQYVGELHRYCEEKPA